MKIDRRQFFKVAGWGAAAGVTAMNVVGRFGSGGRAQAFESMETPETVKAKQFAMVVDMSKFKTKDDIQKVIYACHHTHNVPNWGNPKDEVKWIWTDTYKHVFPGQESPFLDEAFKEMPFLVMCNHCDHPACTRVCPTKATFKRPDGIVMMDYHRCIGCRFCMAACPFGARSFNWRDPRLALNMNDLNMEYPTRTKGVVEKCTFCDERIAQGKQPACVEAAPAGGLVFGDIDDPNSDVRKALARTYTIRRKPELGTGPNIYYVIGGGETNAG